MATKNSQYALITNKRTLPFNTSGTGTVTTVGTTIVGAGTAFLTEMPAGSWLVDLTQNEVRRVRRVDSNTRAYLDQAFSSNVASATPQIIARNETHAASISIQIPIGQPNGLVDNVTMRPGASMTFSKESRDRSDRYDFIDPIVVDATGTQMEITILR